jgi:acid phosphatase type 7
VVVLALNPLVRRPAALAQGQEVTIGAEADAFVNQNQINTNKGAISTMRTRNSSKISYVRFDATGISTATSGALKVWATSASTCSAGADVLRASSDTWGETSINWSNQPGPVGNVLDSAQSWAANSYVSFDVSSAVNPGEKLSFLIRMPSACAAGADSVFNTRESPNDPLLVVETASAQCADNVDNDDDDLTDFPDDPGCTDALDNSETDPSPQQCADNVDNDDDNLTDFPDDPGCTDALDNSETEDPVIAAAGDIACSPQDPAFNGGLGTDTLCHMRNTSDILLANDYDAVLTLGDNQYENGSLERYVASYDPSWGRLFGKTFPAPGNHEYMTAGAQGYFAYFGGRAGDPSKGYYSFDLDPWHLISLNSNCAKLPSGTGTSGCGPGSPQYEWLVSDLQATTARCVLAYWHHPRFSSAQTSAPQKPFWTALYQFDADVVLNGHRHNYERLAPMDPNGNLNLARGIRQWVVGTGGKNQGIVADPFINVLPTSEAREGQTYGILELTLHPDGYTFAFVPELGGSILDSGSGTCH